MKKMIGKKLREFRYTSLLILLKISSEYLPGSKNAPSLFLSLLLFVADFPTARTSWLLVVKQTACAKQKNLRSKNVFRGKHLDPS